MRATGKTTGRIGMPLAWLSTVRLKMVLRQIHGWLGITVGLVLAFMGVTGAIMSFEEEIMDVLSPQAHVEQPSTMPLSPDALLERIGVALPGETVAALQIESDPARAGIVTLLKKPSDAGRNPRLFVNPYTGALQGEATGAAFFETVRRLHRYLAIPGDQNGWGRQITGIAALALIFFSLSGLYLRWPKRALRWRAWFRIDFRLSGRGLYWSLHAVIGSWLILFYLVSALSGLWWSYDWYRNGVASLLSDTSEVAEPREKKAKPAKPATSETPPPLRLAASWQTVLSLYPHGFENALIFMPKSGTQIRIRVLPDNAAHNRAFDELKMDGDSGALTSMSTYAERGMAARILTNMEPIHTGTLFGTGWRILLMVASLSLPFFAVTGLLLYTGRRRRAAPAKGR